MSEFEIIKKYFIKPNTNQDVFIPNGDDCAVLTPPIGQMIAMSMDTLVDGVHFDRHLPKEAIGYKSLAVNLSDLAAMGATPSWAMLALTLPEIDHDFLEAFSHGFFRLLNKYNMSLVGGDTTQGPLSITIQVGGYTDKPIQRNTASVGDYIYVTNTLGDAALALAHFKKEITLSDTEIKEARSKLFYPIPRISEGIKLRNIATSMIDLSDGLLGDLQHILTASKKGAVMYIDEIPCSLTVAKQPIEMRRNLCLSGGDDYELCFTAPKSFINHAHMINATCIGEIIEKPGILLLDKNRNEIRFKKSSFQHFSS